MINNTKQTIFRTPGIFDLRSLDMMGLSSKPNSISPIGRFGTGLKYAISVLLRSGATIELYCNGDKYSFFTKWKEFRESSYEQIFYRKENSWFKSWTEEGLPYTLEYGRDWELWQAFRELYANTLDENGEVYSTTIEDEPGYSRDDGFTYIVIGSNEFADLVATKDQIFLPQNRALIVDVNGGNITGASTEHLYYRGMRAFDLPDDKKSMFTYNVIQEIGLTEDRTIESMYEYKEAVAQLVGSATDATFIKAVLNAPEKTFEAELDFNYFSGAGDTFKKVLEEERNSKFLNRSAHSYYTRYMAPPPTPTKRDLITDKAWNVLMEALEIAHTRVIDIPEPGDIHKIYVKAVEEAFGR